MLKKKNVQDATLKNTRVLKARIKVLEGLVRLLLKRVSKLEKIK